MCDFFPSSKGDNDANGAYAFCWVIGVGCPAVFTRARSARTLTNPAGCVTFALKGQLGDIGRQVQKNTISAGG